MEIGKGVKVCGPSRNGAFSRDVSVGQVQRHWLEHVEHHAGNCCGRL